MEKAYGIGGGCLLAVQEVGTDVGGGIEMGNGENAAGWGKPCFGVWLGSGMRCQEGAYYGSGERFVVLQCLSRIWDAQRTYHDFSFLWKTTSASGRRSEADGVKAFKWTARNDYVALCESDYISFGGG